MYRVRLLHWNANEAQELIELLNTAGYEVEHDSEFRPGMMRSWREAPPDAFVIDLSRLPSHGREIATALRGSPATRHIPIVFCNGANEKISRIQAELPDAGYCRAPTLRSTLRRALAQPPQNPVRPVQMMDRYASRPAAQKLGIKESSTVAMIAPPRDYLRVLGELPANVQVFEYAGLPASVTLCFVRDPDALQHTLSQVIELAITTKLWILWPKKTSRAAGSLSETLVRQHANQLALVDYKICSVNEVWSAMLFSAKARARKAFPPP